MKKRFLKLTLSILCLCIGLVGCSDNGNEDGIGPDDGTGEMAFFTFSIDAGELDDLTRADPEDPEEDKGYEFEYATESVHVLLFNPISGNHVYTFDLDVTNLNGEGQMQGSDVYEAADPTRRHFVSIAKEVVKADYYVLTLINSPSEVMKLIDAKANIKEFENNVYDFSGTDFEQLIRNKSPRYKLNDNTAHYKFFMSNFKRGLTISKEDLKDTAAEAVEKPFPINVDRAVAKVKVDKTGLKVINGEPGELAWKADIINKKMYWIRHEAARADGTWELLSHKNRKNIYAQDPNFSGISGSSSLSSEFIYITKDDIVDECEWEYITENTMDTEEGFDVTTRVVMKFNLIPTGFAAGESYFWYKGVAINENDMLGFYNNPASLEGRNNLDGLRTIIEKYKEDPASKFDDLKKNTIIGLNYYDKGLSYYSIPLRHFLEEDLKSNNYGKYGVVRNNEYVIKLGTISGPGEPDLPPPGETSYLSADIYIQNWYIREQDYDYND